MAVMSQKGERLNVVVRQLPISSYRTFAACLDDEAKAAALLTGMSDQVIESLTAGAICDIIDLGDKVNADFFDVWLPRKKARWERLGARAAGASGSTTTSPESRLFAD